MPWNGSRQLEPRRNTQKLYAKKSRIKLWCLAVLITSIISGIWFIMQVKKPMPEACQKKEVTNVKKKIISKSKPKTKPIEPVKNVHVWPQKNPNRKDGYWRHGEGPRSVAITNGVVVKYPNCPGVEMILPHPKFAAPFKNISDNEIARILSTKSGSTFIDVPLPHDFDEKFKHSLKQEIVITDSDSEESANLKRQVLEARKILLEAIKKGESPREILIEESKNMRRLMGIKDNYQKIIAEEIKKGATDQDIKEIVFAANQLLKKEGINSRIRLPYPIKLRLDKGDLNNN